MLSVGSDGYCRSQTCIQLHIRCETLPAYSISNRYYICWITWKRVGVKMGFKIQTHFNPDARGLAHSWAIYISYSLKTWWSAMYIFFSLQMLQIHPIRYTPKTLSSAQRTSKRLRKSYMKRLRSKEYLRLKNIIPTVAKKKKVDKVSNLCMHRLWLILDKNDTAEYILISL